MQFQAMARAVPYRSVTCIVAASGPSHVSTRDPYSVGDEEPYVVRVLGH